MSPRGGATKKPSKAFRQIMAGLEDMRAHLIDGDKSRGRLIKPPSPSKLARIRGTAYHEAGHAVAAVLLLRGVKYVTVVEEGDALGHTHWVKNHRRRAMGLANQGFVDVHQVVIAVAGAEAERRATGRRNNRGARADYLAAVDVARRDDGTGGAPEDSPMVQAIAKAALAEARALLERNWPAVEAVAAALIVRQRLSGPEVVAAVRGAR